jgi:hypothetical protein
LIDRKGEWVVNPYFSDVRPFRGGVAAVQLGGQPGLVDKTDYFEGVAGMELASPVGDRMAPAGVGGKWGLIDGRGNFVVEPKYQELGDASEGLIPARMDSVWGYVDCQGIWKIEPQFLRAKSFSGGWARVSSQSGKDGWVNPDGRFVTRRPESIVTAVAP